MTRTKRDSVAVLPDAPLLVAVTVVAVAVALIWHLGHWVGLPQSPLLQQIAVWVLVVLSRHSSVQRWLGGGDLAGRPGLRISSGCLVFGAALGGSGLPFLLPVAAGVVVSSHLLWTGTRAWRPGVIAACTSTVITELGVHIGLVPSALPAGLSHTVAVAGLGMALAGTVSVRLLVAERDATHQQRQGELTQAAHHDQLTGLLNRLGMADHLAQTATLAVRSRGTAVVFCDLDGFKAVNDTHGHAAGDALLVAVAGRLHAVLGADDRLARVGGDEFVAVLADLPDRAAAERVAERLRTALSSPVGVDGLELRIGVSVGVAWGTAGTRPDDLLGAADAAMYEEKRRSHAADQVRGPLGSAVLATQESGSAA